MIMKKWLKALIDEKKINKIKALKNLLSLDL